MAGLIDQIQRDALDPKIPVSVLLRKMKVITSKLGLGQMAQWVEQEASGYRGEVPTYRKFHGHLQILNPHRGWMPVHGDPRLIDMFSSSPIMQSIAALEDYLSKRSEEGIFITLDAGQMQVLLRFLDFPVASARIPVPYAFLAGIVDRVRGLILDWSLALEREGIRGDGMSFSETEVSKAQTRTVINISRIDGFAGIIGSDNTARDINMSIDKMDNYKTIENDIRSNISILSDEGVDKRSLVAALDDLKTTLETKPSEAPSKLAVVKSILTSASGGLLTQGTIALITALLGG